MELFIFAPEYLLQRTVCDEALAYKMLLILANQAHSTRNCYHIVVFGVQPRLSAGFDVIVTCPQSDIFVRS